MASSITGIVVNVDFTGFLKVIVFAPFQGAGVNINMDITKNLINPGTYLGEQAFFYDSIIGGYVKWFDTNYAQYAVGGSRTSPEVDNGSITANVVGETDTFTVQYQYSSYGYNFGTPSEQLAPQGIGVTYQPCINGMVRVMVNSEAKPNDHYNYNRVLAQTAQVISPTAGPVLAPLFVVPTAVNDQAGEFDWVNSSNANLTNFQNTKDAIWDLGLQPANAPLTVRVVGIGSAIGAGDGVALGDFLDEVVNPMCAIMGGNGTGTSVQQGNISTYTIPQYTPTTGPCAVSGLKVLSIPTGSTVVVAGVTYTVGQIIPIGALTLVGLNYTNVEEHTSVTTPIGTGTGATFSWDSAQCGGSNEVSTSRTVSAACVPPSVISGGTLPDALAGSFYTHDVTFTGTLPFSITTIVKPVWMTVALSGDTVSLTGTPSGGDAGTTIPVSFEIVNACGNLPFSDTIDVTVTCVNVSGGTIMGPINVVSGVGGTYTVSGLAGTAPYTYMWSASSGSVMSGQGTDTASISISGNGSVDLLVSNCAGAGMVSLTLLVNVYTADAVDDAVGTKLAGVSDSLDVSVNDTACNSGVTSYALVTGSEVNASGVSFTGSTATYTPIANGAFSFQYNILCDGNVIDTATVSGTGCTAPTVTSHPVGGPTCTADLPLTMTVTGTGAPTFQWRLNGANISGQTLNNISVSVAGSYDVVLTNGCGTVTSNPAVLTITTSPGIISGSTLPDALVGSPYAHSIVYSGTLPLSISSIIKPAWLNITLTGDTVSLSGTPTAGDVGTTIPVSFDISNVCDTLPFSDSIDVTASCINVSGGTVNGPGFAVVGQPETYTVTGLSGTAPFTYNWVVVNGTINSGQGTDTINVSFTSDTAVTVTVTNCGGSGSVSPGLGVTMYTADAVDDAVGTKTTGSPTTTDVSVNDTACNSGVTSYALVSSSEVNVSGVSFSGSSATYTPIADGAFSFQYNILCNGNILDTATVSGTAVAACVPPTITTQPGGGEHCINTLPVTLLVGPTGSPTFQWRLNGVNIAGQTLNSISVTTAGSYDVVLTNACGTVTSNAAIITVTTPPGIISGSTLPDGLAGSPYTHNIVYSGSLPLSISSIVKPAWMTVTLSGDTVTFSGTPVLADAGTNIPVSFDITNSCGALPFSDNIDITASCVNVSGGTISGPSAVVSGVGGSYTVSGLSGTAPFTYSWTASNGLVMSGQGTDMVNISINGNGTVDLTVTNCAGAGSVTLSFPVSVYTANAVDDAVGSITVGTPTTLDVTTNDTVCSSGVTTYAPISGSEVNVMINSFSAAGSANFTPTAAGAFSFRYNILCDGNIIDSATVSGTAISGCSAPVITTQPVSATICSPATNNFSVVSSGTAPLAYQWRLNGTNIAGATSSTYTASAAGSYDVVVTNACGTVTSNPAVLTVDTPVTIASGGTLPDGQNAVPYTHTITLAGTAPFSIANIIKPLWLSITLTGSNISFSGTPAIGDVGTNIPISFDISNSCNTLAFSDNIDITAGCVNVSGGSISGPTPVIPGAANNYTVTGLSGTAPYTYTWAVSNGSIISGQGSDTVSVSFSAAGVVSVTITNCAGAGSVTLNFPVTVITADAVDDAVGTKTIGSPTTTSVNTNDVACSSGTTTYALVSGSGVNVSALSLTSAGLATYTPVAVGAFSFQYNILCNGSILDTATVSGSGVSGCVVPSVASGGTLPDGTVGNSYVHTLTLAGTAPFGLSFIIKPVWMTIFLSGSTITFSGTPSPAHTGTNFPVSFNITNACGTLAFSDSIDVISTCVPISGGTISGNSNVTLGVNESYTVVGFSGTPPHTYTWSVSNGSIISGQGSDTVLINPTNNTMSISLTSTNCAGAGTVTLVKTVNVKTACQPTVVINLKCWTKASITCTLTGVTEPNRVISSTLTTVTFNSAIGTHNYTFLVTDTLGTVHTIQFKNIIC